MISVAKARSILKASIEPGPTEKVSLSSAGGRVLRTAVFADAPAPPFNRVMMDGLALRTDAWQADKHFRHQLQVPAGSVPPPLQDAGSVIEIMTGAPLPQGCDTVAPIEWCRRSGNDWVISPPQGEAPKPDRFITRKGSDGDTGREVLSAGQRLGPAELAIAATEGACMLEVNRLPRVCLITTGNEVVPPEQQPGPGQIRGSHAVALAELICRHGQVEWSHHHVPDEVEIIGKAITEAISEADFLLLTGGVSRGRWDLVPEAMHDAGVSCRFHRLAQRPGKPLWFGQSASCQVFGLPGNSNSALVCARAYIVPALDAWRGAKGAPSLTVPFDALPGPHRELTLFHPVWLTATGRLRFGQPQSSGSLHAFNGSWGLVEVPPTPEAGPPVTHPWSPSL